MTRTLFIAIAAASLLISGCASSSYRADPAAGGTTPDDPYKPRASYGSMSNSPYPYSSNNW